MNDIPSPDQILEPSMLKMRLSAHRCRLAKMQCSTGMHLSEGDLKALAVLTG